ncbi:hypothetical protein UAW_03203 [Enterococcus haemoperoxidus ATCC BAA-382]|uniref:Uncharacterized protein n=1 Tax=Enterococcus haemoperoxidus ATCC BAA-382 TaxID=1158608 RepID=R2QAI6_9ENTE|nr:hypothetical protein [Enterococcus haemoperoxidus]EOH92218.1 hypothetical protein UAW_03203 [Enterococcus haemoperoxidus ATCC BAA-382]EOT61903.1 hypothetical protein I583_00886 [Enterococcus haemoperoxidus ATCC BAA-382]OJG54189.1 hypothetical protein RV06_GL003142 [Enterococcus haemoperoxidus]
MSEKVDNINKLANEAKKEVERLEDKRQESLGNSINYIENELQIQRLYAQIEAYEKVLDVVK